MCKGLRPTVNEDIFRYLLKKKENNFQNYCWKIYNFRVNSPVNITEQNFYNSDKYALFSDPNESSDGPNSSIVQEKSCHFENQNSVNIKWSCSVCTYFNWPKSKYCIQCLTVRKVKKSQQSDDSKNSISFGKSENEVQSSTEDTISNLGTDNFSENLLASNNIQSPIGSITNLASSKESYNNCDSENIKWKCDVSIKNKKI